ncbi:rod-binding protein [Asticcacaulis machinosus]|uniref:Rod-binding protein n=1 Tax=Asticcacaulis machinosus TaxID=2984211 RepID=A0ABT5HFI0_9CAUL|nr:rod-binding protein [Asticcacaulis machinosus]MDC7675005.1 rod-binding protein [Asticcacaulis machinosus]
MNLTSNALLSLQGQNTDAKIAAVGDQAKSANQARAQKTGQEFETMVLSAMLQSMFQGVGDTDGLFGGGEGEEAFKSFYTEAIAKQTALHGGIGISDAIQKQLLQLQEAKAAS